MPSGGNNFQSLIGNRYGKLIVISRAEDQLFPSGKKRVRWLCQCECGNTRVALANNLRRGAITSCGCLKKEMLSRKSKKNLAGNVFGKLTAIKDIGSENNNRIWRCRCECGNEIDVRANDLLRGHILSCGCIRPRDVDLTGNVFGELTVLYRTTDFIEAGGHTRRVWRCRCSCGRECDIQQHALVTDHRVSCGCKKQSRYEMWVTALLDAQMVDYKPQVRFDGLTGIGCQQLSYDFAVYDTAGNLFRLIECQGQQHFFPVDMFGGDEQFEKQQMHDDLKREYAENVLHVPLIEIPYTMTENEVYDVLERMIDEMEAQKTKETHIRFNPGVYEGLIEVREEFGMSLSKIVNLALTDNLNRFARKVRFADKKQAAEINASVLDTQKSIEAIRVNLSRIGSNLNQIAKLEHIKKKIAEEEARPRPIQNIIDGYRNDAIRIEQQINAQFNADDLRELVKRFEEATERFGEASWRILA